jgi:hypothetical protein
MSTDPIVSLCCRSLLQHWLSYDGLLATALVFGLSSIEKLEFLMQPRCRVLPYSQGIITQHARHNRCSGHLPLLARSSCDPTTFLLMGPLLPPPYSICLVNTDSTCSHHYKGLCFPLTIPNALRASIFLAFFRSKASEDECGSRR